MLQLVCLSDVWGWVCRYIILYVCVRMFVILCVCVCVSPDEEFPCVHSAYKQQIFPYTFRVNAYKWLSFRQELFHCGN